jgi:hypothetical protein
LDREIRVGAPARRADGSGRRTAGRWVAPPAVAAVRFKRPSGRRTRLSRARLGTAARVPRGTDDPQGPIGREQAGSPAGHPDGALGGRPSQVPQVRAILTGRRRQDRPPPTVGPAQQHPPYRSPQATARPCPNRPTCRTVGSQPGSQSLAVARQVPVLCRSKSRTRSALPPEADLLARRWHEATSAGRIASHLTAIALRGPGVRARPPGLP